MEIRNHRICWLTSLSMSKIARLKVDQQISETAAVELRVGRPITHVNHHPKPIHWTNNSSSPAPLQPSAHGRGWNINILIKMIGARCFLLAHRRLWGLPRDDRENMRTRRLLNGRWGLAVSYIPLLYSVIQRVNGNRRARKIKWKQTIKLIYWLFPKTGWLVDTRRRNIEGLALYGIKFWFVVQIFCQMLMQLFQMLCFLEDEI